MLPVHVLESLVQNRKR